MLKKKPNKWLLDAKVENEVMQLTSCRRRPESYSDQEVIQTFCSHKRLNFAI